MKTLSIIVILTFSFFVQDLNAQEVTEAEQRVMDAFGISQNEAYSFLIHLSKNVDVIQHRFTEIASHKVDMATKEGYIDQLVNDFFAKDGIVEVSSKNRKTIRQQKVLSYLNKLKGLHHKYGYTEIELFFDVDHLEIGKIEKNLENGYEFNVGLKQYFRGCRGDNDCYLDMTYKNLRYNLVEKNGEYILKIKSIKVKETTEATDADVDDARNKHILRFKTSGSATAKGGL